MLPKFENEFLSEIAFSIAKRQRALKHKTFGIQCERVIELESEVRRERLELSLLGPPSSKSAILRAFAWPDRWLWLDAREGSKLGWKWEWTLEGRLTGGCGAKGLVMAIEQSYDLSPFFSEKPYREEIRDLWRPLLALGPRAVS